MSMTMQEIFTKVSTHLLAQNRRSTTFRDGGYGSCRYRGEYGLKCAVGFLISDEDYEKYGGRIEGSSLVDSNPAFREALASTIGSDNLYEKFRLLRNLQNVHDANVVQNWERLLQKVADKFGLDNRSGEQQAMEAFARSEEQISQPRKEHEHV